MTFNFDSTSVPHHTEIANVLINAPSIVIGFDIEGSSISVDHIGISRILAKIPKVADLPDSLLPDSLFSPYLQLQMESTTSSVSSLHSSWQCCHGYCQVNRRKSEVSIFEKENIFVNSERN